MRILALGDIITPTAVEYLCKHLWSFRASHKVDMVIANAENASFLAGISADPAKRLFSAGVDVLTGGNHTMQNRSAFTYMDEEPRMLRPLNFPADVPGSGTVILDVCGYRVLVINAMGTVLIEPILDNPFSYIERALDRHAGEYDLAILDFHAEATGEKVAMGQFLDGRVALVFGTHTHIPTADEQILPHGTGYITDIGCTAPTGGIMGVRSDVICNRFRTKIPHSYQPATGPIRAEGILADVDPATNRCTHIERVHF